MALHDSWEGNVIALSRVVTTSMTDCIQSNVSDLLLWLRIMPSLLANGCDFSILQVTGMELYRKQMLILPPSLWADVRVYIQ